MKAKYLPIFELAKPYLSKGVMKDFIVHTKSVVHAMELIIEGEGGDIDVLIPAAILHDVGFSKVSPELQTNGELEKKRKAQRQHLEFAPEIISEILGKLHYDEGRISQIIDIVKAHKFQDPKELEKQMLIDADNLSDTFVNQFFSDVAAYGFTKEHVYGFRTQNTYYTKTAKETAAQNMAILKQEIAKITSYKKYPGSVT